MDTTNTPDNKPRRINRLGIGFNVSVQILLGLVLFALVNYLAFNRFQRWDYSLSRQGSISDLTRKVIGQLDDRLKVVVLVSPAAPVSEDIKILLAEYQINAKKQGKKIDVETVNPYQDLNRAKELQQKYKFGSSEAVVILDYQKRTKFLNIGDMVEFAERSDSTTIPQMKAFKGEQIITQGLLGVIEPKQTKIYFVEGIGGLDFLGKGYHRTFLTQLERQNLALAPLNLLNAETIPEDAAALLITAPKYDPTDRGLKLLKDYWEKKGRFFIFLDPNQSTPNLLAWLEELGLEVRDDRVKKTENLGDGLLGVYKNTIGQFVPGHIITREIGSVRTSLSGPVRSLFLNQEKARSAQILLTPLLKSDEGYWGETNYLAGDDVPLRFDQGTDHAGPLILAAAVEKGAVEDQRVKVDSSRLIYVSNADFLNDQELVTQSLDFSILALNWLISREDFISIPPVEKRHVRLGLTDDQLTHINSIVFFAIPGAVALLGFAVCWSRRR